jgi:dienelactone hydrolase
MLRRLQALSTCFLVACTHVPAPTALDRVQNASALALAKGWLPVTINAGVFTLAAYLPDVQASAETLTVYIEGDGLAWMSRDTPSADPTPRDPIGLKLALAHPAGAAAYLSRPCQYVGADSTAACSPTYWTDKRFAAEVVAATSAAVNTLKRRFDAQHINLVGYSGGGAVAALVAAQRTDVTLLATVAGNLDHRAWTEHFRVTPLYGSLNPADFSSSLGTVKQVHWVGAVDRVVPPLVAQSYAQRFSPSQRPTILIVDGYDHACCWAKNWTQMWASIQ